ncbi:hypothetical protein Q7C36_003263 [Tachysurus vachellii]|uniref:Uncharacterized protein n=1 Tax=Tachysurus vachellii TaxID=175792 RepID=A0AA88P3E6_TACVA|nr:hypothetical protein Q7C36_003263 [Tachysurus vachellii]
MIRVAIMYVNFNSAVLLFSVEQDIHNPLLKNEINGAQGPSTKQTSGAERSVTLKIPSSSISAFVRDTPTYPLLPPSPFKPPINQHLKLLYRLSSTRPTNSHAKRRTHA